MKKTIIVLISLLIVGCGSQSQLIRHGQINKNQYTTAEGNITLTSPDGWFFSTQEPLPGIESRIAEKLVRSREIGYLIRQDGKALILIESYMLTWGGRPLIPISVTYDDRRDKTGPARGKTGPERLQEVCIEMMKEEKEKLKSYNFDYTCYLLSMWTECLPRIPCLVSQKDWSLSKEGRSIHYRELKYMVGKKTSEYGDSTKWETVLPKGVHGWYMQFTLISEENEVAQNDEALHNLIFSMD